MKYKERELKKGIKLHEIETNKFKTNLIAVMITTKLEKETVTKNAIIPAILRRGTVNMPTQEEINKKLEEMYGASFDCGVDKTGDNQILKFYLESVNDEFLPKENENMIKTSIEKILEIIFNPYIENEAFKKEYIEQEKENLKQVIEGKIDNKAKYAQNRCIEEMYKNKPYGLYRYGYIDDLKEIDEKNLYQYYQELINKCKIDIYVSGIIDESIEALVSDNENVKKLKEREPEYILPKIEKNEQKEENIIQEKMDITQGKLVIGLDVNIDNEDFRYDAMIYNSILGGSANSKLFQNVREKASLAYTASSSYYRFKNNIFINCGIEIKNYDKAVEIIKKQLEEMKNGNFLDEEIEEAKQGIIASIKAIEDEQDSEVMYNFGQELSEVKYSIEDYIKKVQDVDKQKILNVANKVQINTIYFLKGEG